MKKVFSSSLIAALEKKAISEGSSDENFMDIAGKGIAEKIELFTRQHSPSPPILFLCGKGNNSGDAYVVAAALLKKGYDIVVNQLFPIEKASPLCQKKHAHFIQSSGKVHYIQQPADLLLTDDSIIVDAIFGTGLKGAPREPFASIIKKINESHLFVISIDLPSGLDGNSGVVEGEAIKATLTLTLGQPKVGCFINQGWNYTGRIECIDFGLPQKFVDSTETSLVMFEKDDLQSLFPPIIANRHKYEAGYVVAIAGSPGMVGAANLSCAAALKGGAGIVRLLHPSEMTLELVCSIYELIKTSCKMGECEELLGYLNKASSVLIGPGIGQNKELNLKELLPKIAVPLVLDADALNIIAKENLSFPKNCIITPHLGEMYRLMHKEHKEPVSEEFLNECQNFVEKHQITLILKGGPTFILHPKQPAIVVPYGNPGMATAGSGDVLTGLVASLLSQKLPPHHAAIAAVFIHAYAGDCAAKIKTPYCLIASDLIENFPEGFKLLSKSFL